MNLVKVNTLNVEKSPEAIANQIDIVQPSLTQELKIKELKGLDQRFTLTQTALKTGDSATEVIDSSPNTAIAQSVLGQKPTFGIMLNGLGSPKLEPETDLSLTDDLSGNLQTASQVAQQSVNISTPTQIALSLHEASVVSGPLHQEIMTAAKAGGGRIQLELTPPEQGTLRIDLRIDQSGKAHLIVEGANDAAKARLDQGGQQLKNEFAQMGLNLTLDLRQGESHFGQGRQFAENQTRLDPSYSTDRSSRGIGLLSEKFANERLNSAYGQGGSGIHLYA
jgi:flagellar hook-length control protein FliK